MIDDDGFPGTRGEEGKFDGGDTAAIVGTLIACKDTHIAWDKLLYMRGLLVKPDAPVRHPDSSKWYGKPDRFSRDQLIPILCSYLVDAWYDSPIRLYKLHKKRKFLRAWNTRKNGAVDVPLKPGGADFTGPEIWALWIRIYKPWGGIIILHLLDLETLFGSIHWMFRKDRVTRNHMLVCLMGMEYQPTWTMRLAYWLNDWPDLIKRWRDHCKAVREYDTSGAILTKWQGLNR